jgi:Holliday junction resolvasome RuvABC endonuclease subunit
MIILGIDPGINECGVAIVDNGKIVEAGLVRNKSKGKGLEKMEGMLDELDQFLLNLQANVDKVYIEFTYAFSGGSLHNMCKLGAVSGFASGAFSSDQRVFVSSSQWKVKQKKAENHEHMLNKMSKANLNKIDELLKDVPNGKKHNALDAIGIALYGYEQENKGVQNERST